MSAGPWWSARERRALAATAMKAMWSADAPPPWAGEQDIGAFVGDNVNHAPVGAHVAAVRMARHPSTITAQWHRTVADALGELAYVELVGIVCVVAAVTSFRHGLGLGMPALAEPGDAPATREDGPATAEAKLNWVPVAAPADGTAAVVQALTAVPDANRALWSLADVQYIPDEEMVDPRWTRGTLSRPEMELVAVSVSAGRECHY
ncbi:MAG: hypothetical protein RLZZ305_1907 [Actinomycetota bacterium]